jgi:hypothetical protein
VIPTTGLQNRKRKEKDERQLIAIIDSDLSPILGSASNNDGNPNPFSKALLHDIDPCGTDLSFWEIVQF